jgi:hypothetical protein
MAAAQDRDTADRSGVPLDLDALRRDVVDELRRQLRTEFERGG